MTGQDFINFAEEYLHLVCLEFHLNEPSALAHDQSSLQCDTWSPSQPYCRKPKAMTGG